MPDVKLWEVFVSLGIPGLALGVYYMLLRKFDWKLPQPPRGWVGPIIVIFMLLTSAVVMTALVLWRPRETQAEPQLLESLPPQPPENIPTVEAFGLSPLTDEDRRNPAYASTAVRVHNDTRQPIRLAFTYCPRPTESSVSPYKHRVTPEIAPDETLVEPHEMFGGPAHLSVFANDEWSPTNKWVDLKVVPLRTIVISEDQFGFRCVVVFEE